MSAIYIRLHNEIAALEKSLSETEGMLESIQSQQITKDGVYKFISEFGRIYSSLPEINKKELANKFIERVEIFPEEKEDGSIIKSVTFKFPITIGGKAIEKTGFRGQMSGNNVEMVCLLVLRNPVTHIIIDVDVEELVQDKRGQATYPQIKEYVLEQTGLKVSSLYISQIKRKCGLDVGESYNKPKSEDAKVPQCPPEKEKAIMDALRHFGLI